MHRGRREDEPCNYCQIHTFCNHQNGHLGWVVVRTGSMQRKPMTTVHVTRTDSNVTNSKEFCCRFLWIAVQQAAHCPFYVPCLWKVCTVHDCGTFELCLRIGVWSTQRFVDLAKPMYILALTGRYPNDSQDANHSCKEDQRFPSHQL